MYCGVICLSPDSRQLRRKEGTLRHRPVAPPVGDARPSRPRPPDRLSQVEKGTRDASLKRALPIARRGVSSRVLAPGSAPGGAARRGDLPLRRRERGRGRGAPPGARARRRGDDARRGSRAHGGRGRDGDLPLAEASVSISAGGGPVVHLRAVRTRTQHALLACGRCRRMRRWRVIHRPDPGEACPVRHASLVATAGPGRRSCRPSHGKRRCGRYESGGNRRAARTTLPAP